MLYCIRHVDSYFERMALDTKYCSQTGRVRRILQWACRVSPARLSAIDHPGQTCLMFQIMDTDTDTDSAVPSALSALPLFRRLDN